MATWQHDMATWQHDMTTWQHDNMTWQLTWQGRTPPRRASRPDRCLLGTKPLGRKLTLTCFGFSPLREQSLEGESLRGDREPKQFFL